MKAQKFPEKISLAGIQNLLGGDHCVSFYNVITRKPDTAVFGAVEDAKAHQAMHDSFLLATMAESYHALATDNLRHIKNKTAHAHNALRLLFASASALKGVQKYIDEVHIDGRPYEAEVIMQCAGYIGSALGVLDHKQMSTPTAEIIKLYSQLTDIVTHAHRRYETVLVH